MPRIRTYSDHQRKKFDPTRTCLFFGYAPNQKGYILQEISTSKIIVSRNVRFDEHHFPYISGHGQDYEESKGEILLRSRFMTEPIPICTSSSLSHIYQTHHGS